MKYETDLIIEMCLLSKLIKFSLKIFYNLYRNEYYHFKS